jgi:GAF domain-containing protein
MRRRSRAGSASVKSRRRKAATPKRRSSPAAAQETELARRTRERDEALERETATSQVLRLISKSPGDLESVFRSILENATRICEAKFGALILREGDRFRLVAFHNAPPAYVELRTREPYVRLTAGTALAHAIATKQAAQITDVTIHQPTRVDPLRRSFAALTGARTLITVPMLKDDQIVGAINIYRQEVRSFTDKQVGLLTNFATQAVIAIENTRLLNELRQRTGDLSEALEQQTATSDILGVISSSPGELQAVFDIILKNANRLCDAKFSALFIYENGLIRVPSHVDLPPPLAEHFHKRNNQPPIPGTAIETLIRTKRLIHIPDQRGSPEGLSSPATTLAGARTYLAVPLLKDGNVIGAIATFRQEVRPFTDKQIQLVQNFASQTVIAIENARLLNELRERTADLTESLEQQTATSEVLRVISSSSGNLQTVFDTMLTEATDLCEASYGLMWLREEDAFRATALYGDLPQAYRDQWRSGTRYRPGPETILSRVTASGRPIQVPDLRIDPSYLIGDPLPVAAADVAGVRTLLGVPMLKDTEVVGFIGIYRKEIRPFTEKQV